MTLFKLLLRDLRYFARANLATAAGMAVATTVLTGALMVGDSVRGSLRDLTLARLGRVDHVIASPIFFGDTLAGRLAAGDSVGIRSAVVGVRVIGGAVNRAGEQPVRAGNVQIIGLSGWVDVQPHTCVLNGRLADELGVGQGDAIELNLPSVGNLPIDATLARRGRNDVLGEAMQLTVARVVREDGFESRFDLAAGQRSGRNCWVNLGELQQAVGQPGRANLLLVDAGKSESATQADALNARLGEVATLDDYGLHLDTVSDGQVSLRSRNTYLSPTVERAARAAADAVGAVPQMVTVYLANAAERLGDGGEQEASIHYAVVAGLSLPPGGEIPSDGVVLNQWTADQLAAKVGDRIRLTYYDRLSNGDLVERGSDTADGTPAASGFRVVRIVPTEGPGSDRTLTPSFEGLTDKTSVADWEPPAGVRIDKSLVTDADEQYWKEHRAAPKLIVNLDTARRLWGDIFGDLTGFRVPAAKANAFSAGLLRNLQPRELGLMVRPLRAEQLASATGSTDFAELFVGFSFFIIAAAVLLVALLFRLGIEQRARQIGLLGALGFSRGQLRKLALGEGMLMALAGGLAGTAAAIGYGWLMMAGLRTWWVAAVGTTALHLHVKAVTLLVGLVGGVIVAGLAVLWSAWRVGRESARTLLAGAWGRGAMRPGHARWPLVSAIVLGLAAAGLWLASAFGALAQEAGFMGGGFLLLLAVLLGAVAHWRRAGAIRRPARSILRLGVRNAGRHVARSSLTVGLLAFAVFVLVIVAAMRQTAPSDTHERTSGAGGFALIIESDIPLTGNISTPDGRDLLGVRYAGSAVWKDARFVSMRRARGQDISCLNLMQPTQPTVLAAPQALIDRGGFSFKRQIEAADNPWTLLASDQGDAVPVISDDETALYILQKSIGDDITVTDDLGHERRLRLVATLESSIFQGELVMSEANFARLFPSREGFGVVLADVPAGSEREWRRRLSNELADFSATVEQTSDRLAAYQQVANTYLSTFQSLGALGLLLGTIGLAVVLLRGLVERRAELALLGALGFGPRARLWLVMAENAWLLILGMAAGLAASLAGAVPVALSGSRSLNVTSLAATLAVVLLFGLAVLAAAVLLAGRRFAPADLRRE